jgi:4-amino-4-deoxychorismate lyase
MYRFIETIRIEDCQIKNLKYHIDRFEGTRKKFFHDHNPLDIEKIILDELEKTRPVMNCGSDAEIKSGADMNPAADGKHEYCKEENHEGIRNIFKCRIVYSENIESIEILPYTVKKISSLKTVVCNDIEYSAKSADRERINNLFLMKGGCDDILIIKNNLVTDTSFANVLFSDSDKLYTPAAPLLKGTMREKLIDDNKVSVININIDDIKSFQYITLINAMMDPWQIKIPVDNIITG